MFTKEDEMELDL